MSLLRHSRERGGRLRRFAKYAGTALLVVVTIDLVATAATLALGIGVLRR